MTRTVLCRKFQKQLPGFERPPMPGPLGQDIYENVSIQAWQEWQQLQTMLINESSLSMRDAQARRYLTDQMNKFLANEPHDRPVGFVDPSEPDR